MSPGALFRGLKRRLKLLLYNSYRIDIFRRIKNIANFNQKKWLQSRRRRESEKKISNSFFFSASLKVIGWKKLHFFVHFLYRVSQGFEWSLKRYNSWIRKYFSTGSFFLGSRQFNNFFDVLDMTIPFFNFFLQGIIERGHFGIFSDQKDFFHPKNKKYTSTIISTKLRHIEKERRISNFDNPWGKTRRVWGRGARGPLSRAAPPDAVAGKCLIEPAAQHPPEMRRAPSYMKMTRLFLIFGIKKVFSMSCLFGARSLSVRFLKKVFFCLD